MGKRKNQPCIHESQYVSRRKVDSVRNNLSTQEDERVPTPIDVTFLREALDKYESRDNLSTFAQGLLVKLPDDSSLALNSYCVEIGLIPHSKEVNVMILPIGKV